MNKGGQLSIFAIVGIILVVAIVLFFAISGRGPKINIGQEFDNPESFVDKCIRESVRDKTNIMLTQGGFVAPVDYKIYNEIKVAYLCKNVNFYEPCITQYPLYLSRLEEELETQVREDVEACFIELENELENRNYEYSGGDFYLDSTLKPGKIEVIVYRNMSLRKGEVVRVFDSFSVAFQSNLYDLAFVANEIASQEAKFCYFEYVGFMALYPKFDIKKFTMGDSTKIYTIKYKSTGDEMNIAVRGCAIPAGF